MPKIKEAPSNSCIKYMNFKYLLTCYFKQLHRYLLHHHHHCHHNSLFLRKMKISCNSIAYRLVDLRKHCTWRVIQYFRIDCAKEWWTTMLRETLQIKTKAKNVASVGMNYRREQEKWLSRNSNLLWRKRGVKSYRYETFINFYAFIPEVIHDLNKDCSKHLQVGNEKSWRGKAEFCSKAHPNLKELNQIKSLLDSVDQIDQW